MTKPYKLHINHRAFLNLVQPFLQKGQTIVCHLPGNSMLPVIRPNQVVYLTKRDTYRTGQVVLFHHADGTLRLHRILSQRIRRGQPEFFIKGDNVRQPDGWIPQTAVLAGLEKPDTDRPDCLKKAWRIYLGLFTARFYHKIRRTMRRSYKKNGGSSRSKS